VNCKQQRHLLLLCSRLLLQNERIFSANILSRSMVEAVLKSWTTRSRVLNELAGPHDSFWNPAADCDADVAESECRRIQVPSAVSVRSF
jgi:hypothetical protein